MVTVAPWARKCCAAVADARAAAGDEYRRAVEVAHRISLILMPNEHDHLRYSQTERTFNLK
jgi:hypothetical protein